MIEQAEPSLHKLSHDNAWLYCATCTHDNKYDWRLPTFDESRNQNIDIMQLARILQGGNIRAYPIRDYNAD